MLNFLQTCYGIPNWKQSGMRWFPLAVFILLLDLVTKYILLHQLPVGQKILLFPGMAITISFNYGMAFGFLNEGMEWQVVFLITLAVLIIAGLLLWLRTLPPAWGVESTGICLMLGGALGNVINRLYEGYVIDFIFVYGKSWQWPVFNLADMAICLGGVLLAITFVWKRSP